MPPRAKRKRPVSPTRSAAGASGSGQQVQGQGQAVKVVIAERRQVIKAALRGLVEAAQPDLSPAEVDAVVAEVNKRMTMGSKQCVLAAVMSLTVLLLSFLVQLGIWDPQLLAQIRDAMELITKASVQEHLMRGPHHHGIRLLPASELSKGQLKHDSGLTKAKQDTARWSAAIQPQLLQLAAATPAGTTLGCLHAHVLALKATWDALWEEYLKPRWRRQRLALHHAQERVIEAFCKKVVNGMKWVSRHHYHQERGVAVFLGAGNFSQGGWKAGAVRAGFCKVVEQPSRPSADPRPDRLVIVDEFRTSRVSSSVHARQPCELHLPPNQPRPADWVPPAGQVNPRLVRPAWSLRHAKYVRGLSWCHQAPPAQAPPPAPPAQAQPLPAAPGPAPPPQAPPWGRWLDRDTNGCLNLQRIGESRQRPIELCQWDDLEALPPIGKEYQQRYKRVNDRLPKGRQWLHRAAEYRRGIDGRARNNA
ncbi:hypothetical protein QJQ45_006265 [Haematococcus lacustris]|nr:hypothetical protein QJQ45_006265 [Haematococcus lacustris]